MKKLLFLGLLLPLAVLGQNVERGTGRLAIPVYFPGSLTANIPTSKLVKGNGAAMQKTANDTVHMEQIFTTTYDLQFSTNASRRVLVHPDGKVSATCNYAPSTDINNWPNRGSNYNFWDPSSSNTFNGSLGKKIESKRCGYPCIVTIKEGGVDKDVIISHFAANSIKDSSGGFFMETNSGLGSTTFTEKRVHFPYGPLWPRAAVSGDFIHIIGNYFIQDSLPTDTVIRSGGVRQPTVYYRYRISTGKFDIWDRPLPLYDTTRYGEGSGDSYNIDARDNVVAIVIGGMNSDVAVWKSTDSGSNWSKTIVDTFKPSPFNPLINKADTFGHNGHRARTNDGTNSIFIDKAHNVHLVYSAMFTIDTVVGSKSYFFFPGTDQILYWNDMKKQKLFIAKTPGNITTLNPIPQQNFKLNGALYGNSATSTWPSLTVDDAENVYVLWSSPYVNDGSIISTSTGSNIDYRHIYYTYSPDSGSKWFGIDTASHAFNDLSFFALGNTDDNPQEDVFPSLARDVTDSNIHITWMRDPNPGTYILNGVGGNTSDPDKDNAIMYARIPLTSMRAFKFNVKRSGIAGLSAPNFSLRPCYPNPSNSTINIPLNLVKADAVSVKVTDMLGKEVYTQNYGMMQNGRNTLSLDVSTYTHGIYFYTVKVGNSSLTQKMVVE